MFAGFPGGIVLEGETTIEIMFVQALDYCTEEFCIYNPWGTVSLAA